MVAGEATDLSIKVPRGLLLRLSGTSRAATARPYLPETGGAVAFRITRGEATVEQSRQDGRVRSESSPATDIRLRGLRVPDPQFPSKGAVFRQPARHVPFPAGVDRAGPEVQRPGVEQLRWARCPDDEQLHLVQPRAVAQAAASGYALAFCGHQIAAEGLTINSVASGALCMACVVAATS